MAKPLQECKTEAERRENYPQLCDLADRFEHTGQPMQALKALAWIIQQRKKEAAADGKQDEQ